MENNISMHLENLVDILLAAVEPLPELSENSFIQRIASCY